MNNNLINPFQTASTINNNNKNGNFLNNNNNIGKLSVTNYSKISVKGSYSIRNINVI